jgi:1,4-alpha-glucan branching enzyme/maltooligosyltrehalose trehalohydrolase
MPFGCELLPEGGVRFRLWAPAAGTLHVSLEGPETHAELAMQPVGGGWFELDCAAAQAGTRYRFLLDSGVYVPDPASRANPDDVHGPSLVVDPLAFDWDDGDWSGRPWEEAVIYELHVGTFSPEGTFAGVQRQLDYLRELGVTAIELMPVADFPGRRNWGYDGVLAFAPDSAYGPPEALKRLVQEAHRRGLMVFLDVVYNHFGPDGNYLHLYAPQFFTQRRHTPWGAAINFDGAHGDLVRSFYVHNALYWLEEYHFDGLRLDAVDSIQQTSTPDVLEQIARAVRTGPGARRHVHLVLENDNNASYCLGARPGESGLYDAQWNDDAHHALHVLLTGETQGYYADYADDAARHLGRALAEGFVFQGEPSPYRGGRSRGEPSAQLRPTAFVQFLQNHDQIGNRPYGERIARLVEPAPLRAAVALLLLAPSPPLLFMGEEWGAREPFLFFCDFQGDLAARVAEGRREGFARLDRWRDAAARGLTPDPGAETTFDSAQLKWDESASPDHRAWIDLYRDLLRLRAREIVPRLAGMSGGARFAQTPLNLLCVDWTMGDGAALHLVANLEPHARKLVQVPCGRLLYTSNVEMAVAGTVPPWTVIWTIEPHDV